MLEKALFQRFRNGTTPSVHVEFGVDVLGVCHHGGRADEEAFGDFLARKAFNHQVEDFPLAVREAVRAARHRFSRQHRQDLSRDRGVHWRTTCDDFLHFRDYLITWQAFHKISSRARANRLKDVLMLFMDSQHDKLG